MGACRSLCGRTQQKHGAQDASQGQTNVTDGDANAAEVNGTPQQGQVRIAHQAEGYPTVAFYSQPDPNSQALQPLKQGDRMIVVGEQGDWINVRVAHEGDGRTGWVKTRNSVQETALAGGVPAPMPVAPAAGVPAPAVPTPRPRPPPTPTPTPTPAAAPLQAPQAPAQQAAPDDFTVMSLTAFAVWRNSHPGEVAHIKGFGSGMSGCYNADALRQLTPAAIVAWDGDPPNPSGFTALIPQYLQERTDRYAVAFKMSDGVAQFQENWRAYAAGFRARIIVVAVVHEDLATVRAEMASVSSLPARAQDFFALGRVAILATRSRLVVSLGGGGIAGKEAEMSLRDGTRWIVYALSRGNKEQYPSLMDWAASNPSPNMTFVCDGRDPSYANAFFGSPAQAPASAPAGARTAWQADGYPNVAFYNSPDEAQATRELPNGEPLIITGEAVGDCLPVRLTAPQYGGMSGWVKRRNVR